MEFIKVETKEKGYVITLNRPDKRNAFHPQMIKEITSAFREVPDEAHWVLIKGEGKSFCAGADLGYMKSMVDYSLEENKSDSETLFEMFKMAYDCRVPLIAQIHGHAMGGGLGLVAVSDVVIADPETRFAFSEVKLGLVPAVISSFVLHKTSHPLAKELLMSGRTFGVLEAKACHLIEDVLVEDVIESLNVAEVRAIRETKRLIRNYSSVDWNLLKTQTCHSIAKKRISPEAQERLNEFLQR